MASGTDTTVWPRIASGVMLDDDDIQRAIDGTRIALFESEEKDSACCERNEEEQQYNKGATVARRLDRNMVKKPKVTADLSLL